MIRLAFIALLLIATPAHAQSRAWISEFATARVEAQAPFAQLPSLVSQPPLIISPPAKNSQPFNMSTRYIRVVCEVQCAITAKGTPASANDILLPALRPEYFGVQGGKTISIIAVP